jgi:hypothetical protein
MNVFAEQPETALTRDADLLEQNGFTRKEAERLVLNDAIVHATASAGAMYLSLRTTELGDIWNRATRAGARNILLNVRAEGDSPEEYAGQVSVIVLEHNPWPEHDTRPPRVREATRASSATPEQRRVALARINVRRSEILRELADLTEMAAEHEEALDTRSER